MDDLLLVKARQGDERAFEQILTEHEKLIWGCIWRFMRNRADAEDCYIEAAARIWSGLSEYRSTGSFKSWVLTVTMNVCRNMLDARKRKHLDDMTSLDTPVTDTGEEMGSLIPDPAANTEQTVIQRETVAELSENILRLPEDQRTALVLIRLKHMSYAAVAKIERVAEGTIKSRVNRAVLQLKEWMNPPGIPPEKKGPDPQPASDRRKKGNKKT